MRALKLTDGAACTALCLGAHADDIEIGCGGTILRMCAEGRPMTVHWVVFSAGPERAREALASAERFLEGHLGAVAVESFRDGFFPSVAGKIKERFEALAREVEPDVIFTHRGEDLHQDHRLLGELSWQTFRDHLILEYEVPKYDADLGRPNCFFPLPPAVCDRKVEAILEGFPSQRSKHWFSEETFRSLLRLRGIECRSPTGYAEAFTCRKMVLA